ncbi:uncharacterized protein ACN63O_021375 [Diretmus argenteus]
MVEYREDLYQDSDYLSETDTAVLVVQSDPEAVPVSTGPSGKMAEEEKKIPRARITMKPSDRPKAKDEDLTSPTSPFLSLNFELKKMEEEGKKGSSPSSSNECAASAEAKQGQKKDIAMITEMDKMEKKAEAHATTEGQAMDSVKDSAKSPPVSSAVSDNQATGSSKAKTAVPGVRPKGSVVDLTEDDDEVQVTGVKNVTAAPPSTTQRPPQVISIPNNNQATGSSPANTAVPGVRPKGPVVDLTEDDDEVQVTGVKNVTAAPPSTTQRPPQVISIPNNNQATGSSPAKTAVPGVRPKGSVVDLTEDDDEVQVAPEEKCSTSGLKRTLSETMPRDVKRPKVDVLDDTPHIHLIILISALSSFCSCSTLRAHTKIARLEKKFGEANQVSDNKRKQEALAAAAAAAAATAAPTGAKTAAAAAATATTTAATAAATAAKTAAAANTPPAQRGTYNKNIEMESFWSEEWGLSFFNTTMHRNRYREIMRYLRFDKKESRHIRLSSDKFALMSEVWETFVNNSIACYKPAANITVDKQVLPTKARCNFTQYMANEPDKFGIKFWLAADVDSKYVVNGFPYLSKDENRPAHQHLEEGERGDEADGAILPPAQPTPAPTSTAMVTQSSILQLITSSSKAVTTLATGITTQTPTGTLLLKTAAGSNMMGPGQPLLIQLPLSMTNGQTGTLVNFPVSSLSAANSLNKGKTSTTTTTYILKPAPIITVATSSSVAGTVSALQASTGQMSPGQISLARVVYFGGTGGINTPKAGVSVTAARTPAQSVSVARAMSSASSPATSGPAATGSTAPGPPQGTSMTSKTDNQATGSSPAKTAVPGVRPKGSVIDLTEDDDEVQVTAVKNVTAAPPSTTQRPPQVISIPNIAGARSSPQSNLPTSSNPQLTVHHRPLLDSPIKSRAVSNTTPTRASTMSLPPLPSAPAPPGRLPPEAAQTSPPQQPQLKLVPSQTGIVLSWCVSETDRTCATVESYHLYAFHQDNSSSTNAAQQHWKKFGEVEALPLPMACALTRFQSGSTYHFAVRAKDIYGRFGSFCEPQCTNGINSSSS